MAEVEKNLQRHKTMFVNKKKQISGKISIWHLRVLKNPIRDLFACMSTKSPITLRKKKTTPICSLPEYLLLHKIIEHIPYSHRIQLKHRNDNVKVLKLSVQPRKVSIRQSYCNGLNLTFANTRTSNRNATRLL